MHSRRGHRGCGHLARTDTEAKGPVLAVNVAGARRLRNIDWLLILLTAAITVFGVAALTSAAGGGHRGLRMAEDQIAAALLGIILMMAAAALDDHLLPRLGGWIYWLTILMLIAVDIVGASSHGAQRWLIIGPIRVQPSEPAKIALIITLSLFYLRHHDEILDFRTVAKSLIHIGLPMLLVFKQPDLGSSLVIGVIWLGVSVAAGVSWKQIACLFVLGLAAFGVLWHTGVIRDYQKQRLISLFSPDADPQGAGYHIRQSRIAIGSGQLTGKGYMKGTQSQLNFIPEQHTDFIFTVVGEELGFAGAAALVALYWLLIARIVAIMQATEERLGRMIAGGVVAMLLFHVFVNIGMTLGIMPVTGVPLPLASYGRSNLLSTLVAIGLVLGVYSRRLRITF